MTRRAKKRLAFLAGATVLIGAVGTTAHFLRQAQKVKLVAQARQVGLEAYARQDWATALKELSYAVTHNERDAEVMLAFAEARRRIPQENNGHLIFAIRVANEVLDAEPDNQEALNILIDLYREVGFRTELMSTIHALLALDPTNRKGLETAAGLHAFEGRDQEAAQYADMIVETYPNDYDAHVFRIGLLSSRDAEDELNDAVETLVAAFPNSVRARVIWAVSLSARQDEESVKQAVEVIREARSLRILTWKDLTDYLNALDLLAPLEPEFASFADDVLEENLNSSEFGIQAARVALARGFRSGLLAQADRLIEKIAASPGEAGSAALGWVLVVSATRNGESHRAIVEELEARDDREAQWWLSTGLLALDLARRDHTSASGRIEALLAAPEDRELLDYLAATLHAETGEWRLAIQGLGPLVSQSQWRAARHLIARVLLDHRYPADAVGVLQVDRRSDPLLMSLALLRAGEQNPDQAQFRAAAIELTRELVENNPDNPAVLTLRIRACIASGLPAEAIAAARSLLDLAVQIPEADALELARQIEPIDEELARAFDDMAGDLAVQAQAVRLRPRDSSPADITELKRAYLERVHAAEGVERLQLMLKLADVLVATDDPDALGLMLRISAEFPADARAQLAVLGTESAWRDETLVRAAIGRLRSTAAPTAIGWRVFNTRAEYTFGGDADRLSTVTAELADAIRGRPDDPAALAVLAEVVGRQGDLQAAIGYLARAVRADPKQTGTLIRLIGLQVAAGMIDESERRLSELEAIESLPEALLLQRASLLADRGRVQAARDDFAAVQALGRWEGSLGLAVLHLRRNEREESRVILDRMAAVPDLPDAALAAFATVLAALGTGDDMAAAESLLDRMSAVASGEARLRKAALLMRFGDDQAAEQRFRDAAEAGDPRAGIELAGFLLKRDRFAEARTACAAAAEMAEDDPILDAIEDIRQIIDVCEQFGPGSEQTRILQGALDGVTLSTAVRQLAEALRDNAAQAVGDTQRALDLARAVREITDRHHSFFAAWRVLSDAYLRAGDADRAIDAAITASRLMPNDPRAAGLVVGMFMDLEHWNEALFATREWRQRSLADQFDVDFAVAAIQIQREQYTEAFAAVNRWWRDGRDSDDRLTGPRLVIVAAALVGSDRIDEAREILWKPDDEGLEWVFHYLQLSELLGEHPEQARTWIQSAQDHLFALDEGRLEVAAAWYSLAGSTGDEADWQTVIDVLSGADFDGLAAGNAQLMLASSYDNLGRISDAERAYWAGLAQIPDHIYAMNNLAYLLSQQEGRGSESIALAEQSLQLANDRDLDLHERAILLDTLGIAYFRSDRFEEAETRFREAVRADPRKGGSWIGLAETLAAQERFEEARQIIDQLRSSPALMEILTQVERRRLAALEARLAESTPAPR
ncbi:MAG: tetratricopeptide repeat protein [Planctomycetes bacterium]|nr:tetratricopeptide repeat protein [Planctomycetota bacterium]